MNSRTLLLAEDEPDSVALFEYAADKVAGGVTLRVARDGLETMAYLDGAGAFADRQAFPWPDVLVLDLKMPRATGFEVLERRRQRPGWRELAVIVFTASSSPADVVKAYDLGANAFVVKPSTLGELVKVVQAITVFWCDHNIRTRRAPFASSA